MFKGVRGCSQNYQALIKKFQNSKIDSKPCPPTIRYFEDIGSKQIKKGGAKIRSF
jgi:hypothetical protein